MSEAKGGLQFVAAPASGWCEPETGVCHIDAVDETVSAATNEEGAVASNAPDATER